LQASTARVKVKKYTQYTIYGLLLFGKCGYGSASMVTHFTPGIISEMIKCNSAPDIPPGQHIHDSHSNKPAITHNYTVQSKCVYLMSRIFVGNVVYAATRRAGAGQ
jgi:hypothetical protein